MIASRFRVSCGSAPGYQHWRAYRNNQDALNVGANEHGMVAVLCDGCSQGEHSEVGAKLMSRFIAQKALDLLQAGRYELNHKSQRQYFMRLLHGESLCYLDEVVTGLGGDRHKQVQSLFLFTVLAAVITADMTFIFSQGDGVYQLNQHYRVIDENNRPSYLGYSLLADVIEQQDISAGEFIERDLIYTDQLQHLIIASDGANVLQQRWSEQLKDGSAVGLMQQFVEQPRYLKQHSAISRRLNVVNVLNRKGYDDTSIIAIRRDSDDDYED